MVASPKIEEMVDLAESDVQRLRHAKTCRAARAAWTAFLEHSNRAINRLEGHCKKTGQTDQYKAFLKHEIWANPMTSYMRTARNAHEHGVMDTEQDDEYNSRTILPDGTIISQPIIVAEDENGEEFYMTAAAPAEHFGSIPGAHIITMPPGLLLIPVEGRNGDKINPPWGGELLSDDEPHAAAVARRYLAWIKEKLLTFD